MGEGKRDEVFFYISFWAGWEHILYIMYYILYIIYYILYIIHYILLNCFNCIIMLRISLSLVVLTCVTLSRSFSLLRISLKVHHTSAHLFMFQGWVVLIEMSRSSSSKDKKLLAFFFLEVNMISFLFENIFSIVAFNKIFKNKKNLYTYIDYYKNILICRQWKINMYNMFINIC